MGFSQLCGFTRLTYTPSDRAIAALGAVTYAGATEARRFPDTQVTCQNVLAARAVTTMCAATASGVNTLMLRCSTVSWC